MAILERLKTFFRREPALVAVEGVEKPRPGRVRGAVDLVVILDGTMSTLAAGMETNAGLIFRLLSEEGPRAHRAVYYEPGLQWKDWKTFPAVAQGRGISRQIRRAYGWLASRYRPGDRIWLFGYSRGAFAVRSLAGVIDRVGLLQREAATERNVTIAWRHYRRVEETTVMRAFRRRFCHETVSIEMVGVFDTVKALGIRLPLLWMLSEARNAFHDHRLGGTIRHGFHALALDETRAAYAPILWDCPVDRPVHVEQMWFRGSHGDVGGQIGGRTASRPLSNIPLVWMLERAEAVGLCLPEGWRARFPCNPAAPMVGNWRGLGALFLYRRRRPVGRDRSEAIHPTALSAGRRRWLPAAPGVPPGPPAV